MRAPCCDKSKVKKGAWSSEEDLRLITFIHTHGHLNWRSLPNQAGLLRCGKSCRLRWINYLRPDVKRGNFTPQEEDAIIKLHHSLGNKWSKIASHFPGRTDNEIKNVWNTHLKKRLVVEDVDCENSHTKKSYLILSPSSSSSSSTTTTITTFTSRGDNQNREKGLGDENSVLTKRSGDKQINVLTGPSSASSSSNSSCDDDSRSGDHEAGSLGEVDDQVIEEIPLDQYSDTYFRKMLDDLEFEEAADQSDREEECNKWMRYLENELGLVVPTTTTTTGHEQDQFNNLNTSTPQRDDDDPLVDQTAANDETGLINTNPSIDPHADYFPTWPPSPHNLGI